jgi:hypothetical protein
MRDLGRSVNQKSEKIGQREASRLVNDVSEGHLAWVSEGSVKERSMMSANERSVKVIQKEVEDHRSAKERSVRSTNERSV